LTVLVVVGRVVLHRVSEVVRHCRVFIFFGVSSRSGVSGFLGISFRISWIIFGSKSHSNQNGQNKNLSLVRAKK